MGDDKSPILLLTSTCSHPPAKGGSGDMNLEEGFEPLWRGMPCERVKGIIFEGSLPNA